MTMAQSLTHPPSQNFADMTEPEEKAETSRRSGASSGTSTTFAPSSSSAFYSGVSARTSQGYL